MLQSSKQLFHHVHPHFFENEYILFHLLFLTFLMNILNIGALFWLIFRKTLRGYLVREKIM